VLYLTGHGGDEFLKFGDQFELTATELAVAIRQTFALGRCAELLLLVDTCQASTLLTHLMASPPSVSHFGNREEEEAGEEMRVLGLVSSGPGENSYSHDADDAIGVAVSDRFTYHFVTFIMSAGARATLGELQSHLRRSHLLSTPHRQETGWKNSSAVDSLRVRALLSPPRVPIITTAASDQIRHGYERELRSSSTTPREATARWRAREARALRDDALWKLCVSTHGQACTRDGEWRADAHFTARGSLADSFVIGSTSALLASLSAVELTASAALVVFASTSVIMSRAF
jgi:hypothetical protein